MDVVRNNVESLGGQIDIESEFGVGTSVQLRLPLTLAIIPSLIVGAAGARFAVPQASIVELVWVRADRTKERIQCLQGAPMLRLRERLVPLVKVDEVLGVSGATGTCPNHGSLWETGIRGITTFCYFGAVPITTV
jgi:two-component system chemotaxis sensor kinase CheA